MTKDTREGIRQLSGHIMDMDNGKFLVSEQFSRFCREHQIDEMWGGLLTSAGDRPDLYGDEIIRHALFRLLEHICHKRRSEFLSILHGLLLLLQKNSCNPSLFPAVRQDLIGLGYSPEEAEECLPGETGYQAGVPDPGN